MSLRRIALALLAASLLAGCAAPPGEVQLHGPCAPNLVSLGLAF